jgi:uncharacterized protein (TIGR02996 family)
MSQPDFIQEILASPDDDTPRLIYADWLEEQGDPLGEFIRVQCELATLRAPQKRGGMYGNEQPRVKNPSKAKRFRELSDRQMALLMAHIGEWVKPLLGKATGVIFERGCIEGINAVPSNWLACAEIWYRTMPIRQLHMSIGNYYGVDPKERDCFAAVLGSPWFANLRTFEIAAEEAQVRLLAHAPNAANLEELYIGSGCSEETIEALRSSPYLKKVVWRRRW